MFTQISTRSGEGRVTNKYLLSICYVILWGSKPLLKIIKDQEVKPVKGLTFLVAQLAKNLPAMRET